MMHNEQQNYTYQSNRDNMQESDYNQGYDSGYESGYRAAIQMQQRTTGGSEASKTAIVVKCIIIYITAGFIVLFAIGLVGVTIDQLGDNTAQVLERCERYYNERDYRSLNNGLQLYGTYNEKYGKYWEYIEGYELYTECQQWVQCKESGIEGADEKLKEKLASLERLANEAEFPANKSIFEEFIDEINNQ